MAQGIFDLPVLQCKNKKNILYVDSDICNSTIQKRIHISMATLLIFVRHFPEKCAPYLQVRKKKYVLGR